MSISWFESLMTNKMLREDQNGGKVGQKFGLLLNVCFFVSFSEKNIIEIIHHYNHGKQAILMVYCNHYESAGQGRTLEKGVDKQTHQ